MKKLLLPLLISGSIIALPMSAFATHITAKFKSTLPYPIYVKVEKIVHGGMHYDQGFNNQGQKRVDGTKATIPALKGNANSINRNFQFTTSGGMKSHTNVAFILGANGYIKGYGKNPSCTIIVDRHVHRSIFHNMHADDSFKIVSDPTGYCAHIGSKSYNSSPDINQSWAVNEKMKQWKYHYLLNIN